MTIKHHLVLRAALLLATAGLLAACETERETTTSTTTTTETSVAPVTGASTTETRTYER